MVLKFTLIQIMRMTLFSSLWIDHYHLLVLVRLIDQGLVF